MGNMHMYTGLNSKTEGSNVETQYDNNGSSSKSSELEIERIARLISSSEAVSRSTSGKLWRELYNREDLMDSHPPFRQPPPRFRVGSSSSHEEIQRQLRKSPVLGLWGMGGIGKTTIAKAVFGEIAITFEYTLFALNVNQILGTIDELEMKLMAQVYHNGKKMQQAPTLDELRGKKLLVVLDDVRGERDADIVEVIRSSCGEDSRFILTSRNRQLLNEINDVRIYEVKHFEVEKSNDLFIHPAFLSGKPPESLQEYLRMIMKNCEDLPLTMEVLEKYLETAERRYDWEATLSAIMTAENQAGFNKLWTRLEISFYSLEAEEKQMFIDTVTFLACRKSFLS